jgi:hypothetical protein
MVAKNVRELDSESEWKIALLFMYRLNLTIALPEGFFEATNMYPLGTIDRMECKALLHSLMDTDFGIKVFKSAELKFDENTINDVIHSKDEVIQNNVLHVVQFVRSVFTRLKHNGYCQSINYEVTNIDKYLNPEKVKTEKIILNQIYRLTSKGIDVALKLQEHNDNERRFNEQINISSALKSNSNRSVWISSGALLLTVVALVFAFIRLDRTDRILEQSERRLTIAENNQKISDGFRLKY